MTATENIITDKEQTYKELFKSKFYGVLRWNQLDDVWQFIFDNKSQGWYVYQTIKNAPQKKLYDDQLELLIRLIDEDLRQQHDEDYCGVVYVDSLDAPTFIKVFDPKNMGTSCSVGGKSPLPEWIISLMPPTDLNEEEKPNIKSKRWFGNLFSK